MRNGFTDILKKWGHDLKYPLEELQQEVTLGFTNMTQTMKQDQSSGFPEVKVVQHLCMFLFV